MTPEKLASRGTESGHQMAVMQWAALNKHRFPELKWLHHIPNGGSRGDSVKSRKIRGSQLKAEGVKEGVLDLMLPVARGGSCGLYIEMKRPASPGKRAGKPSKEQLEFADFVYNEGYRTAFCDDWKKAVEVLEDYLSSTGTQVW